MSFAWPLLLTGVLLGVAGGWVGITAPGYYNPTYRRFQYLSTPLLLGAVAVGTAALWVGAASEGWFQ